LLSGCSFVSLYSKNISGYAVPARHSSPEKYILRKANFGTGEARVYVGWMAFMSPNEQQCNEEHKGTSPKQ